MSPDRPTETRAPGPLVHPESDEVLALAHGWRDRHDAAARDALVARFLPLSRRLAHRYARAWEPFEDLAQVAAIGVILAVDRFDPDRGTTFVSFVVPTVLGELRRYFRNTGWSAHVPRRHQELALKVAGAAKELAEASGRSPRVTEIAEYLEISVEQVVEGLNAGTAHYARSLDAPSTPGGDGEEATLAGVIGAPDGAYDLIDIKLGLGAAMRQLPVRQRRALTLRMEGNLRQRDIAELMGCSQMQVSRLLGDATRTLRELAVIDR